MGKIEVEFVALSKQYATPKVEIGEGDERIYIGKADDYPYYLLEQFRVSGLHRAIIERKVNMMVGTMLRSGTKDLTYVMANKFETYREVFTKCAYDMELFGGYYIRNVFNNKGSRITDVYHTPYQRVRATVPNQYGFIEKYLVWKKYTEDITLSSSITDFEAVKAYRKGDTKGSHLMFCSTYNPASPYYSGAVYEGSMLDIQTYGEISNYHNSNLHNNFSAGYVIFFRGAEPTPEQKDDIRGEIGTKYKGTENTGTPMVFFLDSDQEAPVITPVEASENAEQFDSLLNSIRDNIAISHQIPRQIVGLASAGSLGQSKEILESSQMFRTDYIEPRQKVLLSGFNVIAKINGMKPMEVDNPNPNALMFGITELAKVLSINEIRKVLGYQDDKDGDVILGLTENTEEIIVEDEKADQDADQEGTKIDPFETDENGKAISKKNDKNRKSKM